MLDFYQRAMSKLDKLNPEQCTELLLSSIEKATLLRTVADSIDVGILVCDKDNNLIFVNKSAPRLLPLNYTEGASIWTSIKDVKVVEFLKDIFINHERVADREIDIVHHNRNKLLSVNVAPLVFDHKINGILIYIEDITEKRKGEARLRRIESLASLTTLAAGVAHEIKNPLGSISIHLQLLQKTLSKNNKSDKKTEKYFNVLKEEVDRLNKIVVNFLFAVRPLTLELRKTDINKLITQTMEFVKLEMEQLNIICFLELNENIPIVLIDGRLIKQVLLNLVKNAQTAMPNGGNLTVTSSYIDNEVKISVRDTGIGIKKENFTKIFEPYFSTNEAGTGLGLTMSYKIIREHQGEITVDSEPGSSTEFKIILPVPQKETRLLAYEGELT
jgi:PAS domain S-box-containing protein